jgi:hypothetical protein
MRSQALGSAARQINPAFPLDSGISAAIIGSHKGRVLTLTLPTNPSTKAAGALFYEDSTPS